MVGCPGSGKSTLGRRLAAHLDVPHVELDGIFHQPGWNELPRHEFRARVGGEAAAAGWVIDGNYSAVRDLVWARADTVVWIDLSRQRIMPRVIARTIRRVLTRQALWNGNREPWANLYRWDDKNIIRWAWDRHPIYRQRFASAMADPAFAHLHFVRLTTPAEVDAFTAAFT